MRTEFSSGTTIPSNRSEANAIFSSQTSELRIGSSIAEALGDRINLCSHLVWLCGSATAGWCAIAAFLGPLPMGRKREPARSHLEAGVPMDESAISQLPNLDQLARPAYSDHCRISSPRSRSPYVAVCRRSDRLDCCGQQRRRQRHVDHRLELSSFHRSAGRRGHGNRHGRNFVSFSSGTSHAGRYAELKPSLMAAVDARGASSACQNGGHLSRHFCINQAGAHLARAREKAIVGAR
jgi:hypothetical protein